MQNFVYDGDQIILALDGSDTPIARYLWGPATDLLLAEDRLGPDPQQYWPLGDHQNSVRDLVERDPQSGSAEIVDHVIFSAFGEVAHDSEEEIGSLFGFTGRPSDPSTNLQNNLHRWYDAALTQWLSEDPIGFSAGDANTRRYVSNDPVNKVDPSGLDYVWVQDGDVYWVSQSDSWLNRRLNRGSISTKIGTAPSEGVVQFDDMYGGGVASIRELEAWQHQLFTSEWLDGEYREDGHRIAAEIAAFRKQHLWTKAPTRAELAHEAMSMANTIRYMQSAKLRAQQEGSWAGAEFFVDPTSELWFGNLLVVNTLGGVLELGPKSVGFGHGAVREVAWEQMTTSDNAAVQGTFAFVYGTNLGCEFNSAYCGRMAQGGVLSTVPGVADLATVRAVQYGGLGLGAVATGADMAHNGVTPTNLADAVLLNQGVRATGVERGLEVAAQKVFARSHGAQNPPSRGIRANKAAGDSASDAIAIREAGFREGYFNTVGGVRKPDVIIVGEEVVAVESKVGLTGLGSRIRQELARDWWLLRERQVDRVRWEFSPNEAGQVGPRPELLAKLKKLGLEVRINEHNPSNH